jgi:hypothetical protein
MRCVAAMMFILSATAVRTVVRNDEEEEEVTYLAMEDGVEEEVTTMAVDSGTMFELGEDSQTVEAEEKKYEEEGQDVGLKSLLEIRTKLKFIGNSVELRNPEMVDTLVGDIQSQMDTYADGKFVLCLHVGTSASEGIKDSRPGFIEGRSTTLLEALGQHNDALYVGDKTTMSVAAFEHFQSQRFAGLVMKVYTGADAPACDHDDLVPPPPQ